MRLVSTLMLVALLATAMIIVSSSALQFQAINHAIGTPGGARFESDIGLQYSKKTLAKASSFVWKTFGQAKEEDRKDIIHITLIVEKKLEAVAYAINGEIHANGDYIAHISVDVKREFTGIIYHETTHLWQWNGGGTATSGLIEGIADYVRLKAGFAPSHWVKPGEGDRWDQGYDVTARFLDYCNSLADQKDFVANLNARMKDNAYSHELFRELLGKTVDQLWDDYKAHFNRENNLGFN